MRSFFFSAQDNYFYGWVIVGCLFYLFEIRKLLVEGFAGYFLKSQDASWNRFEWLFLGLIANVLYWCNEMHTDSTIMLDELRTNVDSGFTDLQGLRATQIVLRKAVAWLSFFSVLKFMKYMNLNEGLSFLWRVLGHAKWELLAFLIVFLLLLVAFSLLFSMLLGFSVREMHNVPSALLSLMRLTVGVLDFDYVQWKNADPTWAPFVLVIFIFLIMLTASNIFIAILTDAYARKKAQISRYKKYKKMLQTEGTMVFSITAAGFVKGIMRQLFPKYMIQVPEVFWPRPEDVNVDVVYQVNNTLMTQYFLSDNPPYLPLLCVGRAKRRGWWRGFDVTPLP